MTRISPKLHRQVNVAAVNSGKSLNAWVTEQLQSAVRQTSASKPPAKKVAAKTETAKARTRQRAAQISKRT